MRNVRNTWMWVATTFAATMLSGCVPPEGTNATATGPGAQQQKALAPRDIPQAINDAYAALGRKQYDVAMNGADRVLAANPRGAGAAEAQYLRGRVFEERASQASAADNVAGAKASLQSAREAYNAALLASPSPALEGNIRAGIANVAYFQEDYATAIAQWSSAYEKITEPQTKAWVLYRIGLSQQRFGNFQEADRTFAAVQQQFPNTEQARRSAAHAGVRGFHVQVGTFNSPTNADSALATLRADGVIGMRVTDPAGRYIVRVGPTPTYDQAKALRVRLAGKYPDALIVP